VIGTAIAGATAERLGADAKLDESKNTATLLASLDSGHGHLGPDTIVVMDEAGMADTNRLAALVQATAQHDSKLVLVGDQAQLSPIEAGGMFTELQQHVPTAELSEVHRARHEWEREAWAQLRDGRAQQALASYQAHDRLHVADTREDLGEQGMDTGAIERLGHSISESHAKQASIATPTPENPGELSLGAGADPPTRPRHRANKARPDPRKRSRTHHARATRA
jgi:ATP-dependent exoDNAse (exonuclease V) alpha subunit